ncbi:NAD(P)/FAD-dependent oxidoreductase [Apibacter raozihei]|uniref:NAD(P)/FAD-dependent oxidoreductase n=1 Tax=Apibacter raozihei TaxID=2500547 RepID=UPI000FE3BD57|nr:NAD(P)/FAD-dependent oxidoreductase [Apibacter raozihei]
MKKRIVLVGGGFAGINIMTQLANDDNYEIILVDKNNYNFFPPLIYQVSSSILEPAAISYPFRRFIRHKKNVHFHLGELVEVKPQEKKVVLSNGEIDYDILIFATGTQSNYFGMSNIEKYAIPMKTLNDALLLRNTLLLRMEEASLVQDPVEQEKLLSIVITGGGPAGVEIAGVLCEIVNYISPVDYRNLKCKVNIYLVEGATTLLGAMSEKSHEESYKALKKLGVKVLLNTRVKDCDEGAIYFDGGEKIETRTIIWTAGVTSRVFKGLSEDIFGKGRRMQVDEFNEVKGYKDIYALGDTCIMTTDSEFPEGHPQLAQVAIQQGKNLAKNLKRKIKNQKLSPFHYTDRGSMAVIGRNKAVADLIHPTMFLKGFIAWAIWSSIHLISLVSVGNKLNTFYRWMTIYFSRNTSLGIAYKIGDKK